MTAVLGGAGAALCWAGALMCSSRASRSLGAPATLAWVMVIGLLAAPVIVPFASTDGLGAGTVGWLVLGGAANVAGLLCQYAGLRTGKVAVVGQLSACEGVVAAALSALTGEHLGAATVALFVPVTLGVVLAVAGDEPAPADPAPAGGAAVPRAGPSRRAAALGVVTALLFGVTLFALGRAGAQASVVWAVLPARVIGVLVLAAPLALARRLPRPGAAAPLVVGAGLAEVLGILSYSTGARDSVAVAAVLSTQFATLGALGAFLVFGERLRGRQVAGLLLAAAGLAGLALSRA